MPLRSLAILAPPSPPEEPPDLAVTHDALLDGRVRYTQPARGYRVAVEAPLLAWFAALGATRPFRHAVDLGAGPGAIALMLLVQRWAARATAVEPAALHAELARRNALDNGVGERLQVVDVVAAAVGDGVPAADLVITNPPYFETHEGPASPTPVRDGARAFLGAGIGDFISAARRLLGRGGRFVVAFPSVRLTELLARLAAAGLHAKRLRFVHPRPSREAQVVFVEAKPGRAGGLVIEPPLCVRLEGEAYAPEIDDALRGRWPTPLTPPGSGPAPAPARARGT
jgi:tRNA1(Val) A37 N6-methylase TrmN6